MQNFDDVQQYFSNLQDQICSAFEAADGKAKFIVDNWTSATTFCGSTRVMHDGAVIEKAAVNFSNVQGAALPATASARYPQLSGAPFKAIGVSLIIHPRNPYAPTTHMNVRYFMATPAKGDPIWWFGGGYDLTPYYPFVEDCQHWHQTAYDACLPFGEDVYDRYKKWCDEYFFLPHRNEARGIGGLFFDDVNQSGFTNSFNLVKSVAQSFLPAYIPILEKRKNCAYGDNERDFQLYRRGRYVEFNLLYDRGTLFGLQSKGRTESILVSLPPLVKWEYNRQFEINSPEAELQKYLQAREWINCHSTVT